MKIDEPLYAQFHKDEVVSELMNHIKSLEKKIEAAKKLEKALEYYSKFTVKGETYGGVFNPSKGDFDRDLISSHEGNPALEALTEYRKGVSIDP